MPPDHHRPAHDEQGLVRGLSAGQQAMIGLGGAIGTGLFLGSGLAIDVAGPAVIVSYVIGAVIALLMSVALTEMCVLNPTAGSFGVYAGLYISPFAGYAVRASYWLMQVIATGGHLVAVSIYMQYWFPAVPAALWIVGFSLLLIYLNARDVGTFGSFEYWFAMVKVIAVVVFVVLGGATILGLGGPGPGLANYTTEGGFFARGLSGVWLGVCFVIYSYIGVEIVAVTSGEAENPGRTIPRAMRRMVVALALIYLSAAIVLVGIMPWTQAGVGESPFVTVLRNTAMPGAAGLMNAIVLSAALSGANANIYLITRTLFSLARAGYVPARLGALNAHGVPTTALYVSSVGLAAAVLVRSLWPDSAYVWFLGVALFGALFVWFMCFASHLAFRWRLRDRGTPLPLEVPGSRAASALGATLIAAVLLSTWWVPGLESTLIAGGPWLLVLWLTYRFAGRTPSPALEPSRP